MATGARKATVEEHRQGYAICDCEKFAFVWRAELLRWLPKDYHGELCPDCKTWTCSVAKLRLAEDAKRRDHLHDSSGRADNQQPSSR